MLNVRHSRLAESVAVLFAALPAWRIAPEVSFSVYGERGVIDILAFHAASGCLLVIELKTEIVDINQLVGTLDRKHRLALGIARERGWHGDDGEPMGDRQPEQDQPASCRRTPSHAASGVPGRWSDDARVAAHTRSSSECAFDLVRCHSG